MGSKNGRAACVGVLHAHERPKGAVKFFSPPKGAYIGSDPDGDRNITADVVIDEGGPGWSGLYDSDGVPLYRERVKFGFHPK